ncbi:integrator complex subunit 2-domain-containing protein [Globomyces pollinis-pini]|nr:integrator complex subunit 2-domain-containing protein [Globomyces pollinis-pini]
MNEMGAAENAGYRCILTRCIFACCYLLGTRCSLEFICNSITKSKVLWSEQLVSLNMCLLCFHIQPGMDVKSNQLFKETMEELLYSTASGFPLTLGLYFIENDIKAAHESINSVLKLQVSLSSERYHYVRHIITEIFSFKKAAEIAFDILKQSKSLKDGADDVSIRLTTHMLSHKAFRDTSIDLQQGICLIFQKLKFDHRLIPLLTKQFCECTFETLSIKRIPSSYILEIFKSDESVDFEKSFLAFYVFLYNSLYSKLNSVLLYDSYGTHVIKSIPIPKLLEFVKVKLPFLFPTMSSLIAVQRPEYFAVENHLIGYSLNHTYLVDKYYLKQDDEIVEDRSFPDYKRLMKILRSDVSKKSLYYTLSVLSKISGEELQQGVEKKSLCLLRDVWYKHYIQSPLETCYETMDKLGNLDTFQLDDLALFENPVIILQSCGRFCGIPELFPIILQIIQFGSANFRYRLAQSKIISPREVETAILTHDALVIHSLFDVLSSKQKSELITTLICKFIHQIFVDRVGCLKVVHFQGYNLDLIPITVSKIPSMHVLTTMVPELLNRPRPQDFIFGFTLFTELCKKYPFDTTLKISKGLLEKLQMIKLEGDIELVCQILIATIPKLLTIASAFPVSMVIPISSYLSDLQMKIPKSNTLSCWGQLETVILKTLANIHNQRVIQIPFIQI